MNEPNSLDLRKCTVKDGKLIDENGNVKELIEKDGLPVRFINSNDGVLYGFSNGLATMWDMAGNCICSSSTRPWSNIRLIPLDTATEKLKKELNELNGKLKHWQRMYAKEHEHKKQLEIEVQELKNVLRWRK